MWGVAPADSNFHFDVCFISFQDSMSNAKMSKMQKSQKVLTITQEVLLWQCSVISSEQVKQQSAEVNSRGFSISRVLAWTIRQALTCVVTLLRWGIFFRTTCPHKERWSQSMLQESLQGNEIS